jgi:serine/threonine protein kinase
MLDINERLLCPYCFEEQLKLIGKNGAFVCPSCGYDERKPPREEERPLNSLPSGSVLINRYIVGKVLGYGGFGITYIAYDIETDEVKAIKEYFPDTAHRIPGGLSIQAQNAVLQERFDMGMEAFYYEAKIITRFEHNPGIVKVYDFFYENGTAYYVMEYIDGVNLKAWVKNNGALSCDKAASVLISMVYLLHDMHSQNVLHGDISPDNIFISRNGAVKLLDFGSSRRLYQAGGLVDLNIKKGFTPKELYAESVPGPWCDIYSLGATIYSLLTGKAPVESILRVDDDESENKHDKKKGVAEDIPLMGERMKWPSRMGIRIPNNFELILKKMMAVDYRNRYQSVGELRSDLVAVTGKEQPNDGRAARLKRARKSFVAVAVTLAVTAFVGLTQVVVTYYDSIYREPVTLESATSSSQSGSRRTEGFQYILTQPSPEIIIVTIMPQLSDDPDMDAQGGPNEQPESVEDIPEVSEGTPEDQASAGEGTPEDQESTGEGTPEDQESVGEDNNSDEREIPGDDDIYNEQDDTGDTDVVEEQA